MRRRLHEPRIGTSISPVGERDAAAQHERHNAMQSLRSVKSLRPQYLYGYPFILAQNAELNPIAGRGHNIAEYKNTTGELAGATVKYNGWRWAANGN
jgi:hypothetical protein